MAFVLLFIVLPVVSVISIYLLVGMGSFGDLPNKTELKNISNPIASELYASNDKLIAKYFIENRTYLNQEDINLYYKNALIATEDHRFLRHSGIDYRSLIRVFIKTILLQRDASGGGSTISQQLAKNLYPRKRFKFFSTVINKFREMHTAKRLEKVYSKDEIIWLYSSTVSFGEQAFGLATASHRFFNKNPKDLFLEEAATLVGMLKATSYYSPRKNPERSRQRRNLVISQMEKYGYLDNRAASTLKQTPLKLDYQSARQELDLARYFKQFVKKEFKQLSTELRKDDGSPYNIYYDGLKITSTLDYDLQIASLNIVQSHMSKLQKIFEESWKGGLFIRQE